MPVGILKYKLPEEEAEFKQAQRGMEWQCAAHEFDEWLRGKIKYGSLQDQQTTYEAVREELRRVLDDRNLSLLE